MAFTLLSYTRKLIFDLKMHVCILCSVWKVTSLYVYNYFNKGCHRICETLAMNMQEVLTIISTCRQTYLQEINCGELDFCDRSVYRETNTT